MHISTSSFRDIRCHCNQPACVRTGYMCKSTGPQAACFVEHSGFLNVDRSSDISRHGCIEMLPVEERTPCLDLALANFASQNGGNHNVHTRHQMHAGHRKLSHNIGSHNLRSSHKSIMCCLDDMCNYVKTIVEDPSINSMDGQTHSKESNIDRSKVIDDIDSLGKHLQESMGINDSIHDGSFLFEFLIFVVILFLLSCLVLLIFCGIRYMRQDQPKHMKQLSNVHKCTRQYENHSNGENCTQKKSMLHWSRLMTTNKNVNGSNVDGKKSHVKHVSESIQPIPKQPLLNGIQFDTENGEHMTKLVDEYTFNTTNELLPPLPNIIVHTLPSERMNDEQEHEIRSTTNNNVNRFARERNNSIYITLLSHGGQPNSNFDLIGGPK
ncbi:hypothetical protein RDWZM_002734 [Blomia tropicalis]|uniref:BMP and activin membrane-bound inhibitor N-terminal domain-containing protein n=1 Tax=Blomia tropicalis TaxID=40697 RepID=A0A9Q0ME91_BLOTA|nr:hypothetical protein RDWZM_002734 [Blomia tropicalis]